MRQPDPGHIHLDVGNAFAVEVVQPEAAAQKSSKISPAVVIHVLLSMVNAIRMAARLLQNL